MYTDSRKDPYEPNKQRGVNWFSSLAQFVERHIDVTDTKSLKHSIQFYSFYAETGDQRYLNLCEDFLKHSLRDAGPVAAPL